MKIKQVNRLEFCQDLMMKPITRLLKKGSMVTKTIIILILLCGFWGKVFPQRNSCTNEVGLSISFPTKQTDSVYSEYTGNLDSGMFRVVNPTKKTQYLFKSYFDKSLQSSKYLHEVDKKNKIYCISFVPIISNLTTKKDDKLIIGENSVCNRGQILYDFVKLMPNTYYDLKIDYGMLFINKNYDQNSVKSYSNEILSKFNETSFNFLTTKKLKGKFNVVVEFAIYDDVSLLCSESAYYLNEFEFDKNARSFKVVNVPIKLNNPDLPLFE